MNQQRGRRREGPDLEEASHQPTTPTNRKNKGSNGMIISLAAGVFLLFLIYLGWSRKAASPRNQVVESSAVESSVVESSAVESSAVESPSINPEVARYIWDKKPYPQEGEEVCGWFTPSWGKDTSLCLRPTSDAVSLIIRQKGLWPDCEMLVTMLEKKPLSPDAIFVDVGANIGACTARVAHLDTINIIAFEPEPHNLFYLTNTLAKTKTFADRVTLFTAGASDTSGVNVIYSQEGNAGNSVVGVPHPDDPSSHSIAMMAERKSTIGLLTLDDALWPPGRKAPHIALMKIDVQGFEVRAFQGAKRLLAACAIDQIKFELSFSHLTAQNTSGAELCKLLVDAGFDLADEAGQPWTKQQCGPSGRGYPDIYATLDRKRCTRSGV